MKRVCLVLLLIACQPAEPQTAGTDAAGERVVFETAPPLAQIEALNDTVESTRRTAIVRAAQRVAPAVVSVNTLRTETVRPRTIWDQIFLGPGGQSREVPGLGSGFIIDGSGLVLTNEHVVRGASEVIVTLSDGRDFDADIVGIDDVTDLALLRVRNAPSDLPVAPLGTSSDLVIGEWAVAIGNPFGFLLSNREPTVTAGVISGLGRNIIPAGEERGGYYLDMIQTDASINPGNSGGPLVNAAGQVIGVNSSIITGSGGSIGLGFAIPIDRARRIAASLLEEGRVRRVWVGADVEPAEPNRFGHSNEVRIASVVSGSPAAEGGLAVGQIVRSVNGRSVHNPLDWEARLLDSRVGETLTVVVSEGGRERRLQVGTADLPSLTAERVSAGSDFQLVTLTPAIRAERGFANERGAMIADLSQSARSLGLRPGDLVVEINNVPVSNAQEVATLLRRVAAARSPVRMVFERNGRLGSVAFYIGG